MASDNQKPPSPNQSATSLKTLTKPTEKSGLFQRWWPFKAKKTELGSPDILPRESIESKPNDRDVTPGPGPSKATIDKTPVTVSESSSNSSSYSGSSTTHPKPTLLQRLWLPIWKPFKKSSQSAGTSSQGPSQETSSGAPTPSDEDKSSPGRRSSNDETPSTAVIKAISPRPTNTTLTTTITDTATSIARRALTFPATSRNYIHLPHISSHKSKPPPTSLSSMHSPHHQRHKSETGSSSVDSSVDSIYEGISGRAASVRSLNLGAPDARSLRSHDIRPRQAYRARSWANMRMVPKQHLRDMRMSFTPMAITGHGDGEYRRHIADLLEQVKAEKTRRKSGIVLEGTDKLAKPKHDDEEVVKKVDKGKGRVIEPDDHAERQRNWEEFLRFKNEEVIGKVRDKSHERTWSTETGYTEERDTDKLSVRTYSGVGLAESRESMALDGFGLTGAGYNSSGRSKLERRRSSRSEA